MVDVSFDLQTLLQIGGISVAITAGAVLAFKPDLIACTLGLGGIRCTFRKNVRDAEQALANAGVPAHQASVEPQGQAGWDVVRKALDGREAAVRDGAVVLRPGGGPAVGFNEAVEALSHEGFIGPNQRKLIDWLYNAGDSLTASSTSNPSKADAISYWRLVQTVVHWLRIAVIPAIERKSQQPSVSKSSPRRRATQVAGHTVFSVPSTGTSAAVLAAISGPLRGKRFLVDHPLYRIGAGSENNLVVASDEYFSGRHAYLRKEGNDLILFDADSRNGTWLNDRRLSGTGEILSFGDRVRVGESTFRVEQATG